MTKPTPIEAAIAKIREGIAAGNAEIAELMTQFQAIDRDLFRVRTRVASLSETLALLEPGEVAAAVAPTVPRAKPGEVEAAVLGVLKDTSAALVDEDIAAMTGCKLSSVKAVLKRLVAAGEVTALGGGYILPSADSPADQPTDSSTLV